MTLGEASPQYQDLLYRYLGLPFQGQTYPGVYRNPGYRGRIFQEQAAGPYLDNGLGAGRPYPDDGYRTDFSPLEAGPYDLMGYRTSNWMQHRNPYRHFSVTKRLQEICKWTERIPKGGTPKECCGGIQPRCVWDTRPGRVWGTCKCGETPKKKVSSGGKVQIKVPKGWTKTQWNKLSQKTKCRIDPKQCLELEMISRVTKF